MSAPEVVATVVAVITAIGTVVAIYVAVSPRLRARRAKRRQWTEDLDGRPPRIENGVTVEPARPSLAAALHDLAEAVQRIDARTEQLTADSGTTMRDAVHRIESDVGVLRLTAEDNANRIEEARRLAGEAAAVAASNDDIGRRDRDELSRQIAELRDHIWERFEETDLRDRTYLAALAELGVDIRPLPVGDDADPEDRPVSG